MFIYQLTGRKPISAVYILINDHKDLTFTEKTNCTYQKFKQ